MKIFLGRIKTKIRDLISPDKIDTSDHFWNSFGKWQDENNARIYIKMCQDAGKWLPITDKDILPENSRDNDSNLPSNWFMGKIAKFVK